MKNFKILSVLSLFLVLLYSCSNEESVQEYITLSQTEISAGVDGKSVQVSVNSNTEWTASVFDAKGNWVTVTPAKGSENGSITIDIQKNTSQARTATVKVFSSKAVASVKISQEAAQNAEPEPEPDNNTTSIAQVREMYTGTSVKITQDIIVEAVVISDFRRDSNGGLNNYTTAKTIVISDGNAGLQLYCAADNTEFARGDKVRINLKDLTLAVYSNGALQVQSDNGAGMPLNKITKIGTQEPVAKEITAAELLTGKYESMYLAIKDVQVAESDLEKTFATSDSHVSIAIESKTGEMFDLFTSKYATFRNEKVPQGSGTLKGISGVYNGKIQLMVSAKSDYAALTGERFASADKFALSFYTKTVQCNAGTLDVELTASCSWTASSSSSDFTVSPASGTESATITISYAKNPNTSDREGKITFTATSGSVQGKTIELVIKQNKYEAMQSDAVNAWLELPQVTAKDDFAYIAHNTSLNGKTVRNYSYWFDGNNRYATWVAYPLYKDIAASNVSRTDEWAYDPKLPQWCQPTLFKSWGTNSGYDRGHQLPSADRLHSTDANKSTFYFTNMVAQNSDFNQGIWGDLENRVRTWASNCDTLYVVTGAVLETTSNQGVSHIKDNEGKEVGVPKYMYKVLLRYSKSNTENGGYSAIGFWMENKKHSSNALTATNAKKIKDIEQLTGFNFFHNLDDNIENAIEDSFNPSQWGL